MSETKEKIELLKDYFSRRLDISMAFLFGSRSQDRAHSGSDWDIAVYFKPEQKIIEWEEQNREYPQEDVVWNDCITILKSDSVDLVVLNRAPASIADTAIRGIPLVIKDRRLFIEFTLIISRQAEDYRNFVDEYYAISQRSTSLIPAGKEILQKTVSFLEEQMALYSYFSGLSNRDYETDIHKRNEVERWIENIVNAGIDIAKIALASQKKPIPDTYRDVMKQAVWMFSLQEDFIGKFEQWVKLRNILAHEYLDIKWKKIEDFIKISQLYWTVFVQSAKEFIEQNKS